MSPNSILMAKGDSLVVGKIMSLRNSLHITPGPRRYELDVLRAAAGEKKLMMLFTHESQR